MNDFEGKSREGKKKIFKEQNLIIQKSQKRSHAQQNINTKRSKFQHDPDDNKTHKPKTQITNFAISDEHPKTSSFDDSKRQTQSLSTLINHLKVQLQEEHIRYDKLFQEYEQIIEKNHLIEKQYINLKYEHNRQLKNLRKHYRECIDSLSQRCHDEFIHFVQHGPVIMDNQAMGQMIQQLRHRIIYLISHMNLNTSKEISKENTNNISEMIRRKKSIDKFDLNNKHVIKSQLKIQSKTEIKPQGADHEDQKFFNSKVLGSPLKQRDRQQKDEINIGVNSKEIVFEDEYYGQLQDYELYDQKIMVRKNYELMKTNRSTLGHLDNRRKKIFNLSSQPNS